jgi:hypothetical protein
LNYEVNQPEARRERLGQAKDFVYHTTSFLIANLKDSSAFIFSKGPKKIYQFTRIKMMTH